MSFKYEVKGGATLVEVAIPGEDLVIVTDGKPYESETQILEYDHDHLKETELKAEAKKDTKPADEGGGS
jgi:hypothetical protein